VHELADNRAHSYVLKGYRRVFGDIEESRRSRGRTRIGQLNGTDIERMELHTQGREHAREMLKVNPREFKHMADVVTYLVDAGVSLESIAHMAHASSSVMRMILDGELEMADSYRDNLNSSLGTSYGA